MKTLFKGLMQLLGELIVMVLLLPVVAPLACWMMEFPAVQSFYNSILAVFDRLIGLFL